ncbi:MAG: hypothetical protein PVF43_12410 [Candidatus Eiseniibacteriota bacterium]
MPTVISAWIGLLALASVIVAGGGEGGDATGSARPAAWIGALGAVVVPSASAADDHGGHSGEDDPGALHGHSALSDEPLPLLPAPKRPKPILEIGEAFLGTGTLAQGIHIPGGAVWQPAFMLFGTFRTAVQTFDPGGPGSSTRRTEWANRFDLFGNLYLTFTERILVGFRPLDRDGRGPGSAPREFTGVNFSPEDGTDGGQDRFNFKLQTLFFEGDFSELFPNLDKDDSAGLDYGLSIGRQPVAFQEGLLINDTIDAVGITKANLKLPGTSNSRWSFLWGWNEFHRPTGAGNLPDDSAMLFGLFTETDLRSQTIEFNAAYVNADEAAGDGGYLGLTSVMSNGSRNLTLHAVGSFATGDQTQFIDDGAVLLGELSWTPHGSLNLAYINGFWGINHFRSIARDPTAGGPLGRTGILFAAVGLGRYGSPLSNQADDAAGGAIGFQKFMKTQGTAAARQQLILEAGGRVSTEQDIAGRRVSAYAGAARFQRALGRRWVVVVDAFAGARTQNLAFDETTGAPLPDDDLEFMSGGRLELVTKL